MVSPAFADEQSDRLQSVLQAPDASHYAKTLACKQAAQTGTKDCVPLLAAMLHDEMLSHPVRIALQQIPDPAATKALCDALTGAPAKLLIGILGSLGERRDSGAVGAMTPLLDSPNTQVVYADAVALGKIGSADALDALQKRFVDASADRKPLYVDGLLGCAESLLKRGDNDAAIQVYTGIRGQKDIPVPARCGAIYGELLARGAASDAVLDEETASPEDGAFYAMIAAVRDIANKELTPKLLDRYSKMDVDRKVLLLDVLDCRADDVARPLVLEQAKTAGEERVKTAAIAALAGLTDADTLAFLLDTATGSDEPAAIAASDALTRTSFGGTETAVVERLKKTSGKACIPLIQVCRNRKIANSTPVLLPLLSDSEESVRLAAIAALGNTVSGEDIEVLLEHLVHPANDVEFGTVAASLKVVCHRAVDPEAVAEKVAAVYADSSLKSKCALLDLFGALGGKVAIEAVRTAVADQTVEIQDTATRVLGDWPDPDAAPVLLEVLKSDGNPKFKIRALRGYIRIIRQMDTSNEHRFNMCMEALPLAQREEEVLLIIDALGRITTFSSLEKLIEFLNNPTYAKAACVPGLNIGKALMTQAPEYSAVAMRKIVEVTDNDDVKRQAEEVLRALEKKN